MKPRGQRLAVWFVLALTGLVIADLFVLRAALSGFREAGYLPSLPARSVLTPVSDPLISPRSNLPESRKMPTAEAHSLSPVDLAATLYAFQSTIQATTRSGDAAPPDLPFPTETPLMPPEEWQTWPAIPQVSLAMHAVHLRGLAAGVNPHAFSVVGDCLSEPAVFMGAFDGEPGGSEQISPALAEAPLELQETALWYAGSFGRTGLAYGYGYSVATALSPLWSDPQACLPAESPLACELRVQRPAVALVMLGTNWSGGGVDAYQEYLDQIVEQILASGAVPLLATKADNREGDHHVNLAVARTAAKYGVPLWNFWRAAQTLPGGGLDENRDKIYLTDEGLALHRASALQALDALRRQLQD